MQVEVAEKWMHLFHDKIQQNKDYLSELDTPIGDGDHGANMARGMTAVVEMIKASVFESSADLFKQVSMQLISKVGGASGPLYGSAFMGIAKAEQLGGTLEAALKAGIELIQKRGKAEEDEKTMLDVWLPVLKDIHSNQLTKEKIREHVERTKDMKATKGRASYLGDRSIGHIDPGAYSSGLLFEALVEAEAL